MTSVLHLEYKTMNIGQIIIVFIILADRTNGRAYATVLRLSVVCLWRYVLWQNGAS